MAFKLIGGPEPKIWEFPVTDSEAITDGECLIMSSGALTVATDATAVFAVSVQAVAAGTGNKCKVILCEPGQIWEADYEGTADAGFIIGLLSADLAAGVNVDAADITGGKVGILKKDTTNKKVICTLVPALW